MLRRKPTKIQLKIEDKEELDEARRRNAATSTTETTGASALLRHFDSAEDSSSKAHRIGLSS
ncbi:putative anaphase-promoting complex, subunit CDC26 [Lupinus albus]|uniref:Putative anaphase-promoting complex, subunit CDC26 n=1 Tax=Lupinus albus TaxID=3870 RepID=A0A6A4PLG4_LUPAL|nr:putative anaphase-promoting complex, subunit CDC26 [Lupinus albus]